MLVASDATEPLPSPFEEWRWVRYRPEPEVALDEVVRLVEASDGSVWASTRSGIVHFDGFRWHDMGLEDAGASPTPPPTLWPAPSGGVVVAHQGRLYRSDGESRLLEHVPVRHAGRNLDVVQAVPLDHDRTLIVTPTGLFRFGSSGVDGFPSPVKSADPSRATTYVRTAAGTLWALATQHRDGGVLEWTGDRWLERLSHFAEQVHVDAKGGVIAVNQASPVNGLWTWRGSEAPARLPDADSGITAAMAVNGEGQGIVTYHSGRARILREGRWRWAFDVPRQVRNARALMMERDGDLWVAGNSGVWLYRASLARWTRARTTEPIGTTDVHALLETPSGDTWLATQDGIVIHEADGGVEHVTEILGLRLGVVTALALDREGSIWVGSGATFSGAFRRRRGEWRHFGAGDGLRAPRVHRIVEDRRGRLWFLGLSEKVGVDEPGAFVYDGEGFEPWGTREGLPNGRVFAFMESPDGALWFGTRGYLSRWLEGQWTHWPAPQPHYRVFTIAFAEGRAWIGHQRFPTGVGYADEEDGIRYLTTSHGLVDDRVWDLRSGPDGALWIATSGGLSRYRQGDFTNLEYDSGLQHTRLWPILPTEDEVRVGTLGGGLYTLALQEEHDTPPPKVALSAPVIDGRRAWFRWRVFPFRSAATEAQTRYRLDGGPWSRWSSSVEVSSELDPGTHRLEVQARGLFGQIRDEPSVAVIEIAPPLYRHPVALGLAFVTVVGLTLIGILLWRRRRRYVGTIEASEERMRALLEQIPIGVHEIDTAGQVTSMNRAGVAMIGDRGRNVIGEKLVHLVAEGDREHVRDELTRALSGESREFEFDLADSGKTTRRLVSSLVSRRDAQGNVRKLVGCLQDITDRCRAETERREIAEQLLHAQKIDALGHLAGGVAHDINNVLSIIGGYAAAVAGSSKITDQTRHAVHQIKKANDRAAKLTQQLLAFSRRQLMDPRVIDVRRVLGEVESMLQRLVEERIQLSVDVASDVGCVRADPFQLEQVIINLVVNARDAIETHGRIQITVENRELDAPRRVRSALIPAGSYVVFVVGDDGAGMTPETQARVFEPFFTTKGVGRGTGLGLSTVFGIVGQSGGVITFESELGRGTEFSVYLPRVDAPPDAGSPDETSREPRAGDVGGTETVLVAEDDVDVRRLVRDTLEGSGYQVITARDGAEAVQLARRFPGDIHALVTDLVMPRLDGRQAAKQFREHRPAAVVLFMTGYASDEVGFESVPEAIVHMKPICPRRLASALRTELDRGVQREQAT